MVESLAAHCCPQCNSARIHKDGIRYMAEGSVQRFMCCECGLRFSERNSINIDCQTHSNSQVCAVLTEAKNLTTATEIKTVAGEIGKTQQDIKGKIVQFAFKLKTKGKTPETIRTYVGSLYTLINKGADLLDPKHVEEIISKEEHWSIRAKRNYTDWYSRFAKFLNLTWEKPDYNPPNKIPFIPLESEIDQLISGSSKRLSIALQTAKETAGRVGEVLQLRWTDIDTQSNIIAINEPEKGSNSGIYKVSSELISRIVMLPKSSERVFGKGSVKSMTNMLTTTKRRLASSFCNPRLLQIHFHTLRHWKLTTYAHAIKDPFQVQMFARHKDMKSTMRYVHLEKILYQTSDKDEWVAKTAKTVEDACDLVKVGFEYVTDIDGFKLFRKRK
jgi:integrase/Zn ribbon nucleic-acid-binding protein